MTGDALFYLFFLPLLGIAAGAWLPKPPLRSGGITFGLSFLPLVGVILAVCFLTDPGLGAIGPVVFMASIPLGLTYGALSHRTTRQRGLAIAGLAILALSLGALVLFIIVIRDFKLG